MAITISEKAGGPPVIPRGESKRPWSRFNSSKSWLHPAEAAAHTENQFFRMRDWSLACSLCFEMKAFIDI